MKKSNFKILSTLLIAHVFTNANAQNQTEALELNSVQNQLETLQLPTPESTIGSKLQNVSLSVGQDKEEIGMQLSFPIQNGGLFNLKVAGPLNESDKPLTLGSLDGLADKTRISLSFQKSGLPTFKKIFSVEGLAAVARDEELLCIEYANKFEKEFNVATCDLNFFDKGEIEQFQDRWFATSISDMSFNFYGLTGTVARDSYSFREAIDSPSSQSTSETDYNLAVHFGRVLNIRTTVVGGFRYERSHLGNPEQSVCLPIDGQATALTCNNLVIGGPTETEKSVAFASLQYMNTKFATKLNINYDLKNSESGVSIPIWLAKSDDDLFNGGIQLDWSTETDDTAASLFVGVPF